jgi:hypothetical protein
MGAGRRVRRAVFFALPGKRCGGMGSGPVSSPVPPGQGVPVRACTYKQEQKKMAKS